VAQKPDVSIVMVNYNQKEYTAQCLDSIYQNLPQTRLELVLVDNASKDGSADWLAAYYPQVKLVRSAVNAGIAGGNNLGIRNSSGRFILLLNNDTLVTPGSIDHALEYLEAHPEAAGVGGNLLNEDGSFQSSYCDFHSLWQAFLIFTRLGMLVRPYYPSHPPSQTIQDVDWMSTAYMLFRRDAIEAIGLVDDEYFIYSDETDLQFRLQQKGWKITYLPELDTVHFGSKSLNPWRRRRLVYRGYLLYFHKHRGKLQTLLLRIFFCLVCLFKLPYWYLAWLLPKWRRRAGDEISSNQSIVRMCLQPGIQAP
jgi:N-acetylglucosaminyl-diphospho-decaprenol L-rhamnosyltransferase